MLLKGVLSALLLQCNDGGRLACGRHWLRAAVLLLGAASFSHGAMAWQPCAKEGEQCKPVGGDAYLMRYGEGQRWAYDLVKDKALSCSYKVYGDVAPHRHKTCEIKPLSWSVCASQGGECPAAGNAVRVFRYGPIEPGRVTQYAYKNMPKGTAIKCDHHTHGDPAPNIAKNCQVAVVPGPLVSLGGGAKKKFGTIDPVRQLMKEVPQAKAFLQPFVGVLQVTGAEGQDPSENQLFKISGKWDRSKYGGGSVLGRVAKQLSALTQELGAPNPVKIEVALVDKNAEYDLTIKMVVQEGFAETGSIAPEIGTAFIFKELAVVLHAKMNQVTNTPEVTGELTGTMFSKLSKWDSWVGVAPSLEFSPDGSLVFGGDITGACPAKPSASTDPTKACKKLWDVLSLGVVTSKGGVMKLSVTPGGVVNGIEAALNDGRISNKPIAGALLVDVDMTPGAGLVLKAPKGNVSVPGLYIALLQKMPGLRDQEPFKSVLAGLATVENESARVMGGVKNLDIIIAPTGLSVGDTSISGSMFKFKGSQFTGTFDLNIDTVLEGDVLGFFKSGAAPIRGGSMVVGADISTMDKLVRDSVSLVPGLSVVANEVMRTFNFKGVEARANLSRPQDAQASLSFTVFSQGIDATIPVGAMFRPDELVVIVVELVKNSAFELGKIVLKGLEEAGKFIANGASIAATEVAQRFEAAYEILESFASLNGKSVSELISGATNAMGITSSDERAWALKSSVYHRNHYIMAYQLKGKWARDGLPEAHFRSELFGDSSKGSKCLNSAPWFDARYYLMKYPGLASHSFIPHCAAVARHWHDYGVRESWRGSAAWDPVYYLAHNHDVAKHHYFGRNSERALEHFISHGHGEGRKGNAQIWTFKDKVKVGSYSRAFFSGMNRQVLSEDIHVCRALYKGRIVVGSLFMDDCELGSGTSHGSPAHAERVAGIEILSAKEPQWVAKGAAAPRGKIPVTSMIDKQGYVRTVCRVKVGSRLHKSGDYFPAKGICRISDSNITKDYKSFDVLYAKQPRWELYK